MITIAQTLIVCITAVLIVGIICVSKNDKK